MWVQRTLRLKAARRGFHLVTHEIVNAIPELTSIRVGLMQVFIQHTSASLTINENADPDVRVDFETAMNHGCTRDPAVRAYAGGKRRHAKRTWKASMMGSSVTIPIGNGRLQLGTWQGIYLCEHRNPRQWASSHHHDSRRK